MLTTPINELNEQLKAEHYLAAVAGLCAGGLLGSAILLPLAHEGYDLLSHAVMFAVQSGTVVWSALAWKGRRRRRPALIAKVRQEMLCEMAAADPESH